MKKIEITSVIGCKINCTHCPQNLLIRRYRERSRKTVMTLNDFIHYLRNIPEDVRISFSGFSEIFQNPDGVDMILYAHEKGYKITVCSTLSSITKEDFESISHIKFNRFCVHEVSQTNKEVLALSEKVHGWEKDMHVDKYPHTRAGNLDFKPHPNHTGRIRCGRNLGYPVLLPNGDVVLCCQDYGLKHIIGSLKHQRYEDLFESDEYKKITRGLSDESIDILCRKCDFMAYVDDRDFDHYLITRFNISKSTLKPVDILDEKWINEKIEIFEKYTLNSVRRQTCKNFKYIILMHHLTEKKYIDYFKSLDVVYDVVLVYDRRYNDYISEFIDGDSDKEFFITSNLDGDDIIFENYIEEVQKCFVPEDGIGINVPFGYLHVDRTDITKHCYRKDNQFSNFIETKPLKTCFVGSHTKFNETTKIKTNLKTAWIYIKNETSVTGSTLVDDFNTYFDIEDMNKRGEIEEKYLLFDV